jgi:K+-sensing histidine kinase KdpD
MAKTNAGNGNKVQSGNPELGIGRFSIMHAASEWLANRRTPEPIDDIVLSAVERFSGRPGRHHIARDPAPDLPLISAEPLLLEQVLSNPIENATRYAGTAPEIVRAHGGQIRVQERVGGGTLVEFTLPLAAHARSFAVEASEFA